MRFYFRNSDKYMYNTHNSHAYIADVAAAAVVVVVVVVTKCRC